MSGSIKSAGFILQGPWMSWQIWIWIHPTVAEIILVWTVVDWPPDNPNVSVQYSHSGVLTHSNKEYWVVRVHLLCLLCREFQAYIADRLPPLAVREKKWQQNMMMCRLISVQLTDCDRSKILHKAKTKRDNRYRLLKGWDKTEARNIKTRKNKEGRRNRREREREKPRAPWLEPAEQLLAINSFQFGTLPPPSSRDTHLSVRVFYCRVIFFHEDSLYKLNCL